MLEINSSYDRQSVQFISPKQATVVSLRITVFLFEPSPEQIDGLGLHRGQLEMVFVVGRPLQTTPYDGGFDVGPLDRLRRPVARRRQC